MVTADCGISVIAANPSSGSAGNPIGGAAEQLERYSEQYRAYSIRCRVLANQRDEARAEQAEVSESRKTSASVLRALRGEEEEATRRLEAIRHELEVLRAQTAEQARARERLARARGATRGRGGGYARGRPSPAPPLASGPP